MSLKQNTRRIAGASLFLPLIAVLMFFGRTAATEQNVPKQDDCEEADNRLLSLLDDCVQQRFKDIEKGFGYRRIVKPGDTPHRFKPENAKELKVVDELRTGHLNVALYVAGRSVLLEKPPATEVYSRRLIKGPASVMSTETQSAVLPRPEQLWDQSRSAMLAFVTSDSYNFALGKWKFSARPVRATEQSCLDCHRVEVTHKMLPSLGAPVETITTSQRIGTPLGVVLYAYERQTK